MEVLKGQRHIGTYLFTFYDQVGVLLRTFVGLRAPTVGEDRPSLG